MSPPAPATVHVPDVGDCVPAAPVDPMSAQSPPVGQAFGGGGAELLTVSVSNPTVLSVEVLCDVTARPARSVPDIEMFTEAFGIGVQLSPSVLVYAVTVPL